MSARAVLPAWAGLCVAGALADIAARGASPAHAVFLVCALLPALADRLVAAAGWEEGRALAASAWLLAAATLVATADKGGLFALWLALPVALSLAEGRSSRTVWEAVGLTALAAGALGLAAVLQWEGPRLEYGALPAVSAVGVATVAALAAARLVISRRRASAAAGTPDASQAPLREALAAAERERDAVEAAARDRARFFASMSHELRTPLNAILGFSDMMRTKLFGPLPAKYAEHAEYIHESARHLLDLVGDVLDVSRIEAGRYELEIERFDARDAVQAAARMIRPSADARRIAFLVRAGEDPIDVDADLRALKQMILNLASNAVKFSREGGVVTITARGERRALVVEVSDTGPGLTPEEIARIGKPFVQTREGRRQETRSSGLGLSLVRSLAELHGGAMEIESAPGRGSTFRLRLPVLAGAPADGKRAGASR